MHMLGVNIIVLCHVQNLSEIALRDDMSLPTSTDLFVADCDRLEGIIILKALLLVLIELAR